MLRAIVNVHILDDGAAKTILGEHTLHNLDKQGL